MARRRSADVTLVLRYRLPPRLSAKAEALTGHKKRPRVRGLGLRRWPRQRRVHSSGTRSAVSRKSNRYACNFECFGQDRPGRPRARAYVGWGSSSSPPAAPQGHRRSGPAGRQRLRRDRLSRDDGRPRQDAAPGDARGHPGPAPPARRPGRALRRRASGRSTSWW